MHVHAQGQASTDSGRIHLRFDQGTGGQPPEALRTLGGGSTSIQTLQQKPLALPTIPARIQIRPNRGGQRPSYSMASPLAQPRRPMMARRWNVSQERVLRNRRPVGLGATNSALKNQDGHRRQAAYSEREEAVHRTKQRRAGGFLFP